VYTVRFVGKGTGPTILAPVRKTVRAISLVDLSSA